MTTEDADTFYSVISPIKTFGNTTLFKLFSQLPLYQDQLAVVFEEHQVISEHDWPAYPHFNPPEKFAAFKLAAGLMYCNAWENAASAMEMSAIAGKNAALLLRDYLKDTLSKSAMHLEQLQSPTLRQDL